MEANDPERHQTAGKAERQKTSTTNAGEGAGRLFVNLDYVAQLESRLFDGIDEPCAEHQVATPGNPERQPGDFSAIVGSSPMLRNCMQTLREASVSDANVLICGETGTGKELFARAIHANSSQKNGRFIAVDCTVLPESIIGSLLFGYERGAFTGADQSSAGLIRQAHCGTLFLDEVGELSSTLQKAFLRVLQEHRFRPIGSSEEVESDFRLLAASNRDLHLDVELGLFRQDLLYRLQTCLIELPPLRSRSEDIEVLTHYHVDRLCRKHGFAGKQLAPDLLRTLCRYPWPGNVRELINALEQAIFMAQQESTLFAKHLPQHIRIRVARSALTRPPASARLAVQLTPDHLPPLNDFRTDIYRLAEKKYLTSLLRHARQNVNQACRLAGLSRSRLYSLLKKHQLSLH